jgi:Domain of unknown function (DUF929)
MTSRSAQRKSRPHATNTGRGAKGRKSGAQSRDTPSRRNAIVSIGLAVLAALIIIGIGISRHPQPAPATSGSDAAEAVRLVTNVPAATLDASSVGAGVSPVSRLADGVPALTQEGKPEVLYIGAEYCPFCAAQRWPVIVALSRFGTFQGLGVTTSSSTDAFPNTPTFTFHGATYSSPYIAFSSVEGQTNTGAPLETPTAEQQALLQQFDAPPYTSAGGAIPFLMIGNRYVQIGSSYQPNELAGMTRLEVAQALADPSSSPAAQEILSSADMLTAGICQLTGGQPSDVCQSPGVTQAAQSLPTQAP